VWGAVVAAVVVAVVDSQLEFTLHYK